MDRTETRTKPSPSGQPHWHAGFNQPGYLPESEPGTFSCFEEARDALAEDMAEHTDSEASWDVEHDCDDVPCPTFGDSCHLVRAGEIMAERGELEEAAGPEWSGHAAGLVYWVCRCTAPICASEPT